MGPDGQQRWGRACYSCSCSEDQHQPVCIAPTQHGAWKSMGETGTPGGEAPSQAQGASTWTAVFNGRAAAGRRAAAPGESR